VAILTINPAFGFDMSDGIMPRGDLVDVFERSSTAHRFSYIDDYGDYSVERFYGFGFGYDAWGDLALGRITAQERIVDGGLAFTVEGLDVSVATLLNFVDIGDVQGELAYVFRGDDLMEGGDRDDTLFGMSGDDELYGYGGSDDLYGGAGQDYMRGGDGDDYVDGGAGADDAHGNAGDDTVRGGLGDDWVVGGKGYDDLYGEAGRDLLLGNLGDDYVSGGEGDDVARGGQGNDVVAGGAGSDWLAGDRGNDTLTGGAGADTFHMFGAADLDVVTDFSVAEGDRVQLSAGSAYTVSQVGLDTVVSVDGAGRMILEGVQVSSLPAGWIFTA
jgi:Ca2+-binding RTX toxin-like protein